METTIKVIPASMQANAMGIKSVSVKKISAFMHRVWNYKFVLDGDTFSVKECIYTFAGCLIGLAFVFWVCYAL